MHDASQSNHDGHAATADPERAATASQQRAATQPCSSRHGEHQHKVIAGGRGGDRITGCDNAMCLLGLLDLSQHAQSPCGSLHFVVPTSQLAEKTRQGREGCASSVQGPCSKSGVKSMLLLTVACQRRHLSASFLQPRPSTLFLGSLPLLPPGEHRTYPITMASWLASALAIQLRTLSLSPTPGFCSLLARHLTCSDANAPIFHASNSPIPYTHVGASLCPKHFSCTAILPLLAFYSLLT